MNKKIKIPFYSLITIIVLVVILLFSLTTQPFLKNVLIPILEKTCDSKITVKHIDLSLLKGELDLKDFSIAANDKSFTFKTQTLLLDTNIIDLISNRYIINRLNLTNSNLTIVQKVKEKLAKDSIDISPKSGKQRKTSSSPVFLNLKNINVKNFNLLYYVKRSKKEDSSKVNVTGLNLSIPKIKTGEKGKIKYNCSINVASMKKNALKSMGQLNGKTFIELNQRSFPVFIKSNSTLNMADKTTPIQISLTKKKPRKVAPAPFAVKANITNMSILPVFKTLVNGSYNTQGLINELDLSLTGTDINNIKINRNIIGTLAISLSDIKIPTLIFDYPIANIIFLPIYIIAHLNSYLEENKTLPPLINKILGIANNILAGAKNINFRTVKVNLQIYNGIININKFLLTGGKGCAVRRMESSGNIDLNNYMNLFTVTNITGIVVPLNIYGTLKDPAPDIKTMIPAILGSTTENILKFGVETGIDLGTKLEESAEKFIKKATE
ncbi:MAG: hypothetical protein K9L78_02480 [Victivallales bacterium]|nr:hypothetical protein [Victivallales bacterium]MCF7888962.1 hypothetical protein [Victivallales bacterium]